MSYSETRPGWHVQESSYTGCVVFIYPKSNESYAECDAYDLAVFPTNPTTGKISTKGFVLNLNIRAAHAPWLSYSSYIRHPTNRSGGEGIISDHPHVILKLTASDADDLVDYDLEGFSSPIEVTIQSLYGMYDTEIQRSLDQIYEAIN